MNLINLFLQYNEGIEIFFHIISLIEVFFFILPLQIKEAGVKNGLAKLRIQLLIFGITMIATNIFSMLIVYIEFGEADIMRAFLQFLNAIGYVVFSTIGVLIYNQQYTDENKILHEKLDKTLKRKEANK